MRTEFEENAKELMNDAPPGGWTSLAFQYYDEGWDFTHQTNPNKKVSYLEGQLHSFDNIYGYGIVLYYIRFRKEN